MTPTFAWAVVRPDGTPVVVCLPEESDSPRAEAELIAQRLGPGKYHAVRVRIEEVRE